MGDNGLVCGKVKINFIKKVNDQKQGKSTQVVVVLISSLSLQYCVLIFKADTWHAIPIEPIVYWSWKACEITKSSSGFPKFYLKYSSRAKQICNLKYFNFV